MVPKLLRCIGLAIYVFGSPVDADPVGVVQTVRAVMATPEDKIDFAKAKLTFDKVYDPSTDIDAALEQIDDMAKTIRAMAGSSAPSRRRLAALHSYIYEAGPWNRNTLDGKMIDKPHLVLARRLLGLPPG